MAMKIRHSLVLTGAIALWAASFSTAQAHHRAGHGGGPSSSGTSPSEVVSTSADVVTLTTAQQTFLESLIDGSSDEYGLISEDMRDEIQSQIDTLPPGIQQRLARGRELPPGIAKKVTLPQQVNEELDIDDALEIVVVGPNIVILDPFTNQIVGLLADLLL